VFGEVESIQIDFRQSGQSRLPTQGGDVHLVADRRFSRVRNRVAAGRRDVLGAQTHRDVQVTLKDAARLRMDAWPTDNSVTSFAGTFEATAVPCEAQYDWVEATSYLP
jgi:hypothetical protein